jgi:hypothetical protein
MIKISDEVKEFCQCFFEVPISEEGFTIEELEREYLEYYSINNEVIS